MYPTYRPPQASVSYFNVPAITIPPAPDRPCRSCHSYPYSNGQQPFSPYFQGSSGIQNPLVPRMPPIHPPAISALISSNRQTVAQRKQQRKAEAHKTIPCRAWIESGRCNYGRKCKFAHGDQDLRRTPEEPPKVYNNPRYRTELCVKYHVLGSCPYGDRCSYIHEQAPKIDLEKCVDELITPSLPCAASEELLAGKPLSDATKKDQSFDALGGESCNDVFRDPFSSAGQKKEDIELRLLPFMDSFIKRPFHVR